MLIDVHSHPILKSWKDEARKLSPDPQARLLKDGMDLPEWSPGLALDVMDSNDITVMMLSAPSGAAIAGRGGEAALARAMNDEMAVVVNAHPTRFGAFAVLPLFDIDQTLAEVTYALDELKFDGVCLTTNGGGKYLGDEYFAPLFAELDRRRTVAFVHPDTPAFNTAIGLPFSPSILEYMFDTTRAITSMIYSGMRARFPNFSYIAAHAGGTIPFVAGRVAMATKLMPTGYGQSITPDDVSRLLSTFHFDVTASTSAVALTGLLSITTPAKLLAGFDFPYMPAALMPPARAALAASTLLDDRARSAIDWENALGLLPGLRTRLAAAKSPMIADH